MKRLFSFMMALVLVLSLSVTAFAAEDTGSITITNATVGKEYSVFKIFDATVKDGHTTYSINPGDLFYADLFGTDGKTDNAYFVYHESTGVITRKDGTNNEEGNEALITYLTGLVANKTATVPPITAESETVTFTGLDYGYYMITSTLGTAVTIHEVTPTAEVIDKNQKTTELDKMIWDEDYVNDNGSNGKWVEASSSNVGDIVKFKVEFTATNYDGETKIDKYTITDTLSSAWAGINIGSISVKVGDETLTADAFTVNPVTSNDVTTGFTLEIPWVNNDEDKTSKYPSPSAVVITYSATVLEAAASADSANKNTVNSDWDSEGDTTTTKVYNLGFTKVDGTNNAPLSGAKFGLYSDENCTTPVNVTPVADTQGVYMYDKDSPSNVVETYDDGQVVIQGLEAGTYYLKETEAPAGYNEMDEAKAIVVGDTNQSTVKGYTVNNERLDIANFSGMKLPSTGGKGTIMLITIGSMVAMAFAVLLITHKKMSVYHD